MMLQETTNLVLSLLLSLVPKTLEELRSAVDGRSPAECLTAIQRIHSCNHPSLSASNKKQLEQFLPIMLDYCVHLSEDPVPANLETLDKLVGYLQWPSTNMYLFSVCVCVPQSAVSPVQTECC